jgi:hypothetical protein
VGGPVAADRKVELAEPPECELQFAGGPEPRVNTNGGRPGRATDGSPRVLLLQDRGELAFEVALRAAGDVVWLRFRSRSEISQWRPGPEPAIPWRQRS